MRRDVAGREATLLDGLVLGAIAGALLAEGSLILAGMDRAARERR